MYWQKEVILITIMNYYMNDVPLQNVKGEKYLGVVASDTLSFSGHIVRSAARVNNTVNYSVMGLIRRNFTFIDK